MNDIEAAARRAERRIKAVSLQHHAHEDSAVLLHALLVDVPAAIEEEFMALRSALLARLARVEEALRFYADEGTYCLSHPAHGGYECCGGGDEGPIIEDRGSKARAALAKNAGNTPPPATGEAGTHGPGKCLPVDGVEFDRAVASREQDERERWIRADERERCAKGVEKARAAFCEAARRFAEIIDHRDRVYGLIDGPVFLSAYRALLAAERDDPRRGEDGAAIDAQDPMAEYVAASLAWWLDESEAAEHLEGETWKRFHRAYYRLPLSVRMGAR